MTRSRRIILNTLATYGRSVFAMLAGVFSSRWLLQGLGAEDLGLQGVVGSLIGALVIFETVMQVAVARFYAYAIGTAQALTHEEGRDEVRRWFNVVFFIHLVLPAFVLIVGWPLGLHAVRHWLTIPMARMDSCLYVFHCSMLATAVSMVTTPYIAMYQAKQEIIELSLFNVVRTLINFGFTFSLLYVTCDRLKYSATFGLLAGLAILGVQTCRAHILFPECRLDASYLIDWGRMKQILIYFFWEIFSCTGNMTRQQGTSIVINKCFGPSCNASWQIAQTLSNQATALSAALIGAIGPAAMTEEGSGERSMMLEISLRSCKFGALLILLFSVPLIAEMDEVLKLWLVTPPPFTGQLCTCVLIAFVIEKLGLGHHLAIASQGKVGLYHAIVGTTFFLSIPIALCFVWFGYGPISVGYMFIVSFFLISLERVVLAKYLVDMPVRCFLKHTFAPIVVFSLISYLSAKASTLLMPPCLLRICLTTMVSLTVMFLLGWYVLDDRERDFVRRKLANRISRKR